MNGFNPEVTSHGNFKCPYCVKRKVMKTKPGMVNHIRNDHEAEAKLSEKEATIKQLEVEKSNLKWQLERVQKPVEKKREFYDAHVFCTHCKNLTRCGMPKGALASTVACPVCSVVALHLVSNVTFFR